MKARKQEKPEHTVTPSKPELTREQVKRLPETEKNALRAEALGLVAKGQAATGNETIQLAGSERARLAELIRCGLLPSDPPAPEPITPERNAELRELARKRNEAGRPNPKAHALAVKIIAAGGRDKADPADVARLDRMLERPGAGGRAVPAFLNNEAEAERVRALQAELTCEALAENAADAANVAAASVRRQNLVTNLDNLPDGPIGDALRALSPDARQVYQLRQGMNAKGRRNSWAAVAEHFRSERKRGKRYTRQRVQQIYRAAVEAFPILEDFARLQAGRKCARNVFDCDEEDRETNDVPGAYSTGGHVKAEAVFDKTELAPDREGGARYRVTRDLRNREI